MADWSVRRTAELERAMIIKTDFELGDRVKRKDHPEIGEVTAVTIEVGSSREPATIIYDLHFSKYESANGGASFGCSAYESELEAAK